MTGFRRGRRRYSSAVAQPRPKRPNVLIINCDDLGYGDLGCYGSTRNATPRLDGLAAEGIRFTDFYQASPVCSPSRAALLTGCYPPRIGFADFEGLPVLFPGQGLGLNPEEQTLASLLRDAGYRTQMVGKWHCGDQPDFLPTNHGFERYLGLPYSNDMGVQANPPDILDWLPPLPLLEGGEVVELQPDQASLTGRYVAESLRFLREDDERPFFLYLAHLYVHLPIYVTEERLAASRNGAYGAAVESIDWATGVLLDELDALGLAEDTFVLFTSDNGSLVDRRPWGRGGPLGGSNAPLRGSKGSTDEGGFRVPAILRWKGQVAAGLVSDELLSSLDLLPSIAVLCGAPTPELPIDGLEALGALLGNAPSPRDGFAYYKARDLEAVRNRRYKLRLARDGEVEAALFDLDQDPGEAVDLTAELPEVVADLEAFAERVRAELGDARLGLVGAGQREPGRVANPKPLAGPDLELPWVVAEYDLEDKG